MKKSFSIIFILFFLSVGNLFSGSNVKNENVTDLVKFCSSLRGFNLLGKFDVSWSNSGYAEKEFSMMQQLGFNFVRLPIDYRTYTVVGDWNNFVENQIQQIDKAVEWGTKYNIHICINLHRAPGYCVNSATLPANQQLNLWTDVAAQNAFVNHWKFFANRYKDIASDKLSFNLVNEPANVSETEYIMVMKKAIEAIRTISPERIIFVDGLDYGRNIVLGLKNEPNVAQSIHCYDPFGLTHYKAEWVSGSAELPVPKWPQLQVSNYLYGPWKSELKSPLIITGTFPKGTEVIVNVRQVSVESTLLIKAGNDPILSKSFVCGPDTGSDFSKVIETEWGYQNISNKDFSTVTNMDATQLSFENSSGDWMKINSISLKMNDKTYSFYPADDTWGKKQSTYLMDGDGNIKASDGSNILPFEFYRTNIALAKDNNIAFMVQEFGVYNKTPHDVTVAFLSDLVTFLYDNEIGWALWNFTGSFGILNSDRSDCVYEPYQGYQLDRTLLNAITQNYTGIMPLKETCPFEIYPCPAISRVNVSCADFKGAVLISLMDISGKKLREYNFSADASGIYSISTEELNAGIYLLSVVNNGIRFTKKLVVR